MRVRVAMIVFAWGLVFQVAGTLAEPINFNDFTVQGIPGQDQSGTTSILDGGLTLRMTGNNWKHIQFSNGELTNIPADLIIKFGFRSDEQGDIHGIMLGTNVTTTNTFKVYGTQPYGDQTNATYTAGDEGTFKSFRIPVGQNRVGDSFTNLTFLGDDDDNGGDQVSFYRNVELVPEPATSGLVAISLLVALICRRRRA